MKKILLLLSIAVIYSNSYAHRGYVFMYNASDDPVTVDGVKRHHPHWIDSTYKKVSSDKKDIAPESAEAFYITESMMSNDVVRQEFVIYPTGKEEDITKSYFLIGSDPQSKRVKYIANDVSYMTAIPNEGVNSVFFTSVTNKIIRTTTIFDDDRNSTNGGTEFEIHNLKERDYSQYLVPMFGININGIVGFNGKLQNFVAGYVWVGDDIDMISFVQRLTSDISNDFFPKSQESIVANGITTALDMWAEEKYSTEKNADKKISIVKWYSSVLSTQMEPIIEKLVKDNKKYTGIWSIVATASSIAGSVVKGDREGVSGKAVKGGIDIFSAIAELADSSNGTPEFKSLKDCKDIKVEGLTLIASCKDNNGAEKESSLYYYSCFADGYVSVVENNNGTIQCVESKIDNNEKDIKSVFHIDEIIKGKGDYLNIISAGSPKSVDFKYKNKGVDIDISTEIDAVYNNHDDKTFTVALGNRDGEEPQVTLASMMMPLDQDFKMIPVEQYFSTCSLYEDKKITCDNEAIQDLIYQIYL